MKTIFCHNSTHLGDCIQTIHFLNKSSELNDVEFEFNCNEKYFNQIESLLNKRIKFSKERKPNSIETWVNGYGRHFEYQLQSNLDNNSKDQSKTFLLHWQEISKLMNIKCPFEEKNDLIYDEEVLNEKCKHDEFYDYLIINSRPLSGQCSCYSESQFKNLCDRLLHDNKKIITTQKIENIPCTHDFDLNVVEIGKLSKNVKNIIAVNTGPLHLCINRWTVHQIKFIIIISCGGFGSASETFDFGPNFQTKFQIN